MRQQERWALRRSGLGPVLGALVALASSVVVVVAAPSGAAAGSIEIVDREAYHGARGSVGTDGSCGEVGKFLEEEGPAVASGDITCAGTGPSATANASARYTFSSETSGGGALVSMTGNERASADVQPPGPDDPPPGHPQAYATVRLSFVADVPTDGVALHIGGNLQTTLTGGRRGFARIEIDGLDDDFRRTVELPGTTGSATLNEDLELDAGEYEVSVFSEAWGNLEGGATTSTVTTQFGLTLLFDPGTAPPTTDFDWRMPDRYGDDLDRDGLVDSFAPDGLLPLAPAGWRVDFDATPPGAGCDPELTRHWFIDGVEARPGAGPVLALDPSRCTFSYRFAEEGRYDVLLEERDASGAVVGIRAHVVTVQDWLVVSLGDSVASGEGVPETPLPRLGWQNRPCHRSALAGPARAAQALERDDPRTSVTFVHLACSGATISTGILGPYEGQEPRPGLVLPPQFDQMLQLTGGREIDAVLVSIGANDVKFSHVLRQCLLLPLCENELGPQSMETFFSRRLERLPALYDALGSRFRQASIPADRVYLTEYFDPTRKDNQEICPSGTILQDALPATLRRGAEITVDEATWASDLMLPRLNIAGQQATARNGWRRVGGIFGAFRPHGYCAQDRWVVTYDESIASQGNQDGTIHPNRRGHVRYGTQLRASLGADLYEAGGSPRAPTLPE